MMNDYLAVVAAKKALETAEKNYLKSIEDLVEKLNDKHNPLNYDHVLLTRERVKNLHDLEIMEVSRFLNNAGYY